MAQSEPIEPVTTEQVRRLRVATGMGWMDCERFLASLTPAERRRHLDAGEVAAAHPGGILRDPIEDDPAIRPLFLAVCEEATRDVQEWHQQWIRELEGRSPAVADLCRSGRGLCHRIWSRIQELLRERHNIEWRSPREMNPWVIFD